MSEANAVKMDIESPRTQYSVGMAISAVAIERVDRFNARLVSLLISQMVQFFTLDALQTGRPDAGKYCFL